MGLYGDIGNKIKNWAKWIFIIESIGAVITGFVFLILWGFEDAWWALLTIIFGPIVAYVSTWTLYAFGQFVDDINVIRHKLPTVNGIEKNMQNSFKYCTIDTREKTKKETQEKVKPEVENTAKQDTAEKTEQKPDDKSQEILPCPHCGENLTFMGWDDSDLQENQFCPLCGKEICFKH